MLLDTQEAAGAQETLDRLAALEEENLGLQQELVAQQMRAVQMEAQLEAARQAVAAVEAVRNAAVETGVQLTPGLMALLTPAGGATAAPSPGIACQFPSPALPSPGIACQFPTPADAADAAAAAGAAAAGSSVPAVTPGTALKQRRGSLGLSRFALPPRSVGGTATKTAAAACGAEGNDDGSPVEGLCERPAGSAAPATAAKPRRPQQLLAHALVPEGFAINPSDTYNASHVELNPNQQQAQAQQTAGAPAASALTPTTAAAVETVRGIAQMMKAASQGLAQRRASDAAALMPPPPVPSAAARGASPLVVAAAQQRMASPAVPAQQQQRGGALGSPVVSNQGSNNMSGGGAAPPAPAAAVQAAAAAAQVAAVIQALSPGVRHLLSGSIVDSIGDIVPMPSVANAAPSAAVVAATPAGAAAAASALAAPSPPPAATVAAAAQQPLPVVAAATPGAAKRTLPLQYLLDIQATPAGADRPADTFLYFHPPTGFRFELGPAPPASTSTAPMDVDGDEEEGGASREQEMAFCPVDLGAAAAALPAFLKEDITFGASQKGKFVFRLMEALNKAATGAQRR